MQTTRREFLQTTAAAGTAVTILPTRGFASLETPGRQRATKRLLILGGTGFIGPHMVEYALSRGHEVTLFNRGRTNTHLFPQVEKLVGDRSDDLDALKGRTWDVVLDNHATIPRWVRRSAELLRDSADQYIHVSTISTYDSQAAAATWPEDLVPGSAEEDRLRVDEDSKLAELPEDYDGSEQVTGRTYGPFKVLAEQAARDAFPGRTTVVRPGLIVGPGDPTDRFTYWPVRIDRGGEVLAPSHGLDSTQIIDVRDLTQWIVRLAEQGVAGTFNATGPASRLSMAELLYGIRAVTNTPTTFTWVDLPFLLEREVRPWGDLPVWLPRDPISFVRVDRAMAAGLTFRPLAETARDTIDWHATRPSEARASLRAGLAPAREAELLEMWQRRVR